MGLSDGSGPSFARMRISVQLRAGPLNAERVSGGRRSLGMGERRVQLPRSAPARWSTQMGDCGSSPHDVESKPRHRSKSDDTLR